MHRSDQKHWVAIDLDGRVAHTFEAAPDAVKGTWNIVAVEPDAVCPCRRGRDDDAADPDCMLCSGRGVAPPLRSAVPTPGVGR